ncbi:MAG TPA: hypothetical protein VGE51_03100 [Fontimonas sp.]
MSQEVAPTIDSLPGFRRRFRITPAPGRVQCDVEDDYHCMSVVVHHAGGVATHIEPRMSRAPWTTCPGAVAKLQQTFAGTPLAGFSERGEKTDNCTHLYDLALLAAAHAGDATPLIYDILVADAIDGRRHAELRRDGKTLLAWVESEFRIVEPASIGGTPLMQLGRWIASLEPSMQEPARLLRWGNLLAHGRAIPMERQSDATRMPSNCYSFQPQRAVDARRVGEIRDFSRGGATPLGEVTTGPDAEVIN